MSLCRHCLGRFDARESYCRQLVGGLDILVSAVNDVWKLPSIWFSACVVGLGAHVVTVVGCSDCGWVQTRILVNIWLELMFALRLWRTRSDKVSHCRQHLVGVDSR